MSQTIKYIIFLFLFTLSMSGCEEKIIYEDSLEVGSIYVDEITDNTIHVYTGETFQVKMNLLPPEAKVTEQLKYVYSSGNEKVFTVNGNGVISGVSPGEAILYVEASNYSELKTIAMVSVTDEIFPVTEIRLDERLKNLALAIGDEIVVGEYLEILPEKATNKQYSLAISNKEVLALTESGTIKALSLGESVLTIKALDGSNVTATSKILVKEPSYTPLDRSTWTVSTSHNLPDDAAIKNAPESLIDGSIATCLSMVKPGKSYAGVTVGANEEAFFIIDMKEKSAFNYFKIFHRTSNTQLYLRVWGVSLFGSNDGKTFEPIGENIPVEYDGVTSHTARLMHDSNYRYLKVQYSNWDPKSGSTVQIAEFELGVFGF